MDDVFDDDLPSAQSRRSKRADRRAAKRRMQRRAFRLFYRNFGQSKEVSERAARRLGDNLRVCSCWICGGSTKYERRPISERKRIARLISDDET